MHDSPKEPGATGLKPPRFADRSKCCALSLDGNCKNLHFGRRKLQECARERTAFNDYAAGQF